MVFVSIHVWTEDMLLDIWIYNVCKGHAKVLHF